MNAIPHGDMLGITEEQYHQIMNIKPLSIAKAIPNSREEVLFDASPPRDYE
jgi:hypothetical protein